MFDEVSESKRSVSVAAPCGDEEEVTSLPAFGVGGIGGRALFQDKMPEDTAEDDNGQPFFFKVHEEDAPRLAVLEGTELMDGFDLGGVLVLQTQLGGLILESEIVETVFADGPVQFVFEVADEFLEGAEMAEVGAGMASGFKADAGLRWARRRGGRIEEAHEFVHDFNDGVLVGVGPTAKPLVEFGELLGKGVAL